MTLKSRDHNFDNIDEEIRNKMNEFIESNSVTLPQEAPKTKKIKRKDISEVLENSTILIYH